MATEADVRPQYPIGTVAQRTGLSTHVLRAWERRYGTVEPERDAGGVRLYSNADIVRLRLLRRVTEAGQPIGRVARLTTEELLSLVREEEQAAERVGQVRIPEVADRFVSGCLEAIEAMDAGRIHGTLMRAVVALSLMEFIEGVVLPLLHRVGDLWKQGELCPAHEHLLSVCLQRVLSWLMSTLPVQPGAPGLVSTTPSGQRHELGAMLVAVVAADAGWQPLYFGPDLPPEAVGQAVSVTGAEAVALSVVFQVEPEALRAQLQDLRSCLPGNVHLYVGGAALGGHARSMTELGATWLPDLPALRIALQAAGRGVSR